MTQRFANRGTVTVSFLTATVLITACQGAPAATVEPDSTEASATTTASAEPAATASEEAELALPEDVTLESIGDSSLSGEAHFASQGTDEVAVTVTLEGTEELSTFDAFTLLVLPGTCAEQSEPADFASALDQETVDLGTEAESPVVVPLAELVDSPHSILVTNAPGDRNLACGDIR
jgi:hypothetical protein